MDRRSSFMKKKGCFFALIAIACLMVILEIFYEEVIRYGLPPDWTIAGTNNALITFYPEDLANHLADSFFGMNYLLLAYLFFERKYYFAKTQKPEMEKSWHWLVKAGICQMAALGVYSLVWLSYSGESRLPADVPIRFARLYMQKHSIVLPLPEFFQSAINITIILAPMILYLTVYLFHVMLRWCQFSMQDCLDRKWRNWNLLYIFGTAVLLLVACVLRMVWKS